MGAPRRVVVGYDGSAEATAALRYAASRVGPDGMIVAVYVEEPVPDPALVVDPGLAGPIPRIDPVAVQPPPTPREHPTFAGLTGDRFEGVPVECVVVADWPARGLIEAARERDADEIVIGARRHGRIHDAVSSVFRELVHDGDRPVVIIPPDMSERERAGEQPPPAA